MKVHGVCANVKNTETLQNTSQAIIKRFQKSSKVWVQVTFFKSFSLLQYAHLYLFEKKKVK